MQVQKASKQLMSWCKGCLPQEVFTQAESTSSVVSTSCNFLDAESKEDKMVLQNTSSVLATNPFQKGMYKQVS